MTGRACMALALDGSYRCSERVLKSANSNAVPQSFTDASSLLSIAWHPSLNHDARTTLDPSRKVTTGAT